MTSSGTAVLIVAAGRGERAGGGIPKQYARIGGKAVLAHAVDAFASHPAIGTVQVVIGAGQELLYRDAIGERTLPPPCIGGATRRESVRAGLDALAALVPTRVLIHDAARPFLPGEVIDRLLAALDDAAGAVPVLPVVDSLARTSLPASARGEPVGRDRAASSRPELREPVPRDGLVRVQTPQAFRFADILAAHRAWPGKTEATDDAQVARAAGLMVATVAGDPRLDKLTHAADLAAAEARLTRALVSRSGMGFDVHVFGPGDRIMLGGVAVPHDRGLVGHSDADVAFHALTDALLGAVADGDIGSHFPPSDPRWRGADSARFVDHARGLIAARGGRIDHVDLTIICEAPKVGPHRSAIRARVAQLLQLREGQVSIKATTTERLGFTGRGEGIAAQAIATIRVPEDQ